MAVGTAIGRIRAAVDARNLRERILLLAAILVVLVLVWDVVLRAPLAERRDAAEERQEQLANEQQELRATIDSLQSQLASAQSDDSAERRAALESELESVDRELGERTARVVSPGDFPETPHRSAVQLIEIFRARHFEQMRLSPERVESRRIVLPNVVVEPAFPGTQINLPQAVAVFDVLLLILEQDRSCLSGTLTAAAVDSGDRIGSERPTQLGGLPFSLWREHRIGMTLHPPFPIPVCFAMTYQVNAMGFQAWSS